MSLDYLYYAISWLLLRWHDAWGAVFGFDADVSWVLSIIFLVITIRLILFPLFVKQIKSQRKMQELQPKMKALQTKHKGDKETLQREMMALYKENGANPVAGCLPIFLQAPVFLSLYHVLKRLDPTRDRLTTLYGWTTPEFESAARAKIFGAPISAHLTSSQDTLAQLGASGTTVRIVGAVLIAIMVATTYITQRQMIAKQQAAGTPMDPQQLMIQRLMLYGIPASLLISGALFPLGVVLYWCTTNVWSMGQQFYVLRKMPIIGAPAADARKPGAEPKAVAPKPGQKPSKTATKASGTARAAGAGSAAGKAGATGKANTAGKAGAATDAATTAKGTGTAAAKKSAKAAPAKAAAPTESTASEPATTQSPNGEGPGPTDGSIEPAATVTGSSPNGTSGKPGARPPTNKPKNRKGGRR